MIPGWVDKSSTRTVSFFFFFLFPTVERANQEKKEKEIQMHNAKRIWKRKMKRIDYTSESDARMYAVE